jgi:hypothetical protein
MLLNRLPVLDKGYVAYVDSSCAFDKLKDLALEFFKRPDGKFLSHLSTLTLVIKCPLFVQLNLSTHDLTIVPVPPDTVEAYCPSVGEIGSKTHDTNKDIAHNIETTTEALLINPKAYQQDGCNRFMSQILTPINTYTTIIVHGSYNEWRKFCGQNHLPDPIKGYVDAVQQIITMQWR